MEIPFIDLKSQFNMLSDDIQLSINNVLEHGKFINGPEVSIFEEKLKEFTSANHAITCANGTDAISISLLAIGIKPNDAIFVPSFTYIASVESIALVGGTPYFVDVSNDYNICPKSLKVAIADAKKNNHHPKAVIPVDLFGKPSISDELDQIVNEHTLKVIYDSAQSFGASHKRKKIGNFGDLTTTSFFPAKPLGCYGDGGAIFTNDSEIAKSVFSIKNHGMGKHKYEHVNIGMNSRLDTLQAAILINKINILGDEIIKRNEIANFYNSSLKDSHYILPKTSKHKSYAWAQYTLRHKERDEIINFLNSNGIPTGIYYPIPLNQQPAYKDCFVVSSGIANSEKFCKEVFSIPMSPYLKKEQQIYIIENLLLATS
tara:strand:+ start:3711 stop:4829 length:1119 start_codon:yes stop_codon:yes gene_type:complete